MSQDWKTSKLRAAGKKKKSVQGAAVALRQVRENLILHVEGGLQRIVLFCVQC